MTSTFFFKCHSACLSVLAESGGAELRLSSSYSAQPVRPEPPPSRLPSTPGGGAGIITIK